MMSDISHRKFFWLALTLVSVTWSSVAFADALCPDTTKNSDLTIADVSDLQFDIDRLALCLQRAKLLQQIDETVQKREIIRQEPMVPKNLNSQTAGYGNAFPAIPAMPSLPDMGKIANALPSRMTAAAPEASPPAEWKIQRIWGQGTTMQAQLAQGDTIANVKLNDTLPSGEKITELSARGVTLNNGKATRPLMWLENVAKPAQAGKPS